ncbi:22572_t:CDS:1, partial [Racocetra persica]
IQKFDQQMARRNVILLIDGAPSHKFDNIILNTKVKFFPPKTMSRIQLLDVEIIISFKHHYKSQFVKWIINQYEAREHNNNLNNNFNIFTAINFIVNVWDSVSSTKIINCFHHTNILSETIMDN